MVAASEKSTLPVHGAACLPSVVVDSYNLEIEDDEGFLGDKASRSAFGDTLSAIRKKLREIGDDPFEGVAVGSELNKKKLDAILATGSSEAAVIVQSPSESYAQQLSKVIKRFLQHNVGQ